MWRSGSPTVPIHRSPRRRRTARHGLRAIAAHASRAAAPGTVTGTNSPATARLYSQTSAGMTPVFGWPSHCDEQLALAPLRRRGRLTEGNPHRVDFTREWSDI